MPFLSKLTQRVADSFDRMSQPAAVLLGFVLLGMIGVIEYLTGPEIGVSIFFIIPIALVVWRTDGLWTVVMPIISAGAWLSAELAAGKVYSHWEIGLWKALIRLGFFLIFARLITMCRHYLIEKSAHEAADEVSRLKSNMVSLVSHEYANALTNMKLAMVLLRQSEPASPDQSREHAYGVLDRAIEHLRVSTTNFLDLNRLQSGHLKLNVCRTRMRTVASETLLLLQPIIESKQLRLEVDFPTTPVPVQADPDALSLIMSNLMTNAVKYTPNGGSITVRIAKEEGAPARALFSVADTGIGIPAQDRERILSGFYRTDESRKVAKGFGIGLMLVNELIERHGSHLEIESEPGKGSRFYFYLPLWEEIPS